MSISSSVNSHYSRDDLILSIQAALNSSGVSIGDVTVNDLGPVDEFHVGGRAATVHLLEKISLLQGEKVLDIGCGIGGTGRLLADRYAVEVSGIDLTADYIETAKILNEWVSLSDRIDLQVGNATMLPYIDGEFDVAVMLHVGMNISDKSTLFSEVSRVLNSGGRFVLYDVMKKSDSEYEFPVPWATDLATSYLESTEFYVAELESKGFTVKNIENRGDFSKSFFKKMRKAAMSAAGPSAVGLHLLMGQDMKEKMGNFSRAIFDDILEPTEIVAIKR